MRHQKNTAGIGIVPLLIGGLILSLLLVLLSDGTRFFKPEREDKMLAEILLENLDAQTAAAVCEESAFSFGGGELCQVHAAGAVAAQPIQQITRDGRILLLPSQCLFCVTVTVELSGKSEADGFLAFGNQRLLPGARVHLSGKRTTADGLLLSLRAPEVEAL